MQIHTTARSLLEFYVGNMAFGGGGVVGTWVHPLRYRALSGVHMSHAARQQNAAGGDAFVPHGVSERRNACVAQRDLRIRCVSITPLNGRY